MEGEAAIVFYRLWLYRENPSFDYCGGAPEQGAWIRAIFSSFALAYLSEIV